MVGSGRKVGNSEIKVGKVCTTPLPGPLRLPLDVFQNKKPAGCQFQPVGSKKSAEADAINRRAGGKKRFASLLIDKILSLSLVGTSTAKLRLDC